MVQDILLKLVGGIINLICLLNTKWAGSLALDIYRTPREGRLEKDDHRFLKTSERKEKIGANGSKVMTYTWNGRGKKEVLLLHGWESNAARWEPLINVLVEEDYKVVAIDAPAHGDSDRKHFDMLQYVNAIDASVEKSIPNFVIGHSLGGSSLSYYLNLKAHPDFEKIVLMGVPSELYNMTINFSDMMGFSQRTFKALLDSFRANFGFEINTISVRKFCETIRIKTLVLHDYQDDVALVSDAKDYNEILQSGELYLTKNYGHSMQAEEVYKKIIAFIA